MIYAIVVNRSKGGNLKAKVTTQGKGIGKDILFHAEISFRRVIFYLNFGGFVFLLVNNVISFCREMNDVKSRTLPLREPSCSSTLPLFYDIILVMKPLKYTLTSVSAYKLDLPFKSHLSCSPSSAIFCMPKLLGAL